MRKCYVSRCYPSSLSGGFKAKTDIECIMQANGFINLGLPQKFNKNKVFGFLYTLISICKAIISLRRNDILLIQYPLKKYYTLLSFTAQFKGAKVIALIHDLGCFRRKKITLEQEQQRLRFTNHLIVLSESMKNYMVRNGYKQSMSVLHLWDYLNSSKPLISQAPKTDKIKILFVGSIDETKRSFIYKWDRTSLSSTLHFEMYGSGFKPELVVHPTQFEAHGLVDSAQIIAKTQANYGLLWYGAETAFISGPMGEYIKYNTAHRISLYIHANLPLIIWSKASFASFTLKHNIGICVDSLDDLEERLQAITPKKYQEMVENTKILSERINQGYYFMRAYKEIESEFSDIASANV